MRRLLTASVLLALAPLVAANETADGCKACHADALTLERWDASALTQRIREMRDGKAAHPVPIPQLSDADLEALASALAGS